MVDIIKGAGGCWTDGGGIGGVNPRGIGMWAGGEEGWGGEGGMEEEGKGGEEAEERHDINGE